MCLLTDPAFVEDLLEAGDNFHASLLKTLECIPERKFH